MSSVTTADKILNKISDKPFSYGETLHYIIQEKGEPKTRIPSEEFHFEDGSKLLLTTKGVEKL